MEIDGRIHGAIEKGYMILVGICDSDTEETVRKMAAKISSLRIFEDENGKMNLNIHQKKLLHKQIPLRMELYFMLGTGHLMLLRII